MIAAKGTRKRWAVDRQQLLILLVAAVMVGSFFLLVLWPKQRELDSLGRAVIRERDLVDRQMTASQEGVYVSARIPSLRQAQGFLDRRLPAEPHVAEFLQMVNRCTEAEPAVTHEVHRAEGSHTGPAPSIPFRLRLAGPFDAVYRCLAGIEGLERLSRFRQVRFQTSGRDGRVVAEADILVYYLPDQPADSSSDRPDDEGKNLTEALSG